MTDAIQITVRAGEPLWRALGRHRITVALPAPATLADLLDALARAHPDFAAAYQGQGLRRQRPYRLFVNHRQIPAEAPDRCPLADGDLVHIVIPVAGGK